MRRKDREVKDLNTIKEIISKCEVVRLAMCEDNIPYIVPLNYGYEFDGNNLVLYCHCANSGKKLDINCENIKAVLRRATEIMFGTVNA